MVELSPAGARHQQELLTRQQHTLWRLRHHEEMKALTADQRREFNQRLRQELRKMSGPELARTRAELQAEWDGLPADRRERIERRLAELNGA